MLFGAPRAISLAGFLVTQACELVAIANAIAVARRRRGLNRHQSHSKFLRRRILPGRLHLRKRSTLVRSSSGFELRKTERIAHVLVQGEPDAVGLREKHLDDVGIELRSGVLANFFTCRRDWQGLAVRAVGDHGVERVGHREYSGTERNFLAAQAARIPRAVEALLVSEHDFRGVLEERNAFENRKANLA